MSLLKTYGAHNCVTTSELACTYRQERKDYAVTGADGESATAHYWEVTRYARKSYSFVGMDLATARRCADAKRAQYLRAYSRVDTSGGAPALHYVHELGSDIAVVGDGTTVWSVRIEVNETDVAFSNSLLSDPASLFPANRAYDSEGSILGDYLTLDGADWSGDYSEDDETVLRFLGLGDLRCSLPGFDPMAVRVEYKASASATEWTLAGTVHGNAADSDYRVDFPASVYGKEIYVRGLYGGLAGDAVHVDALVEAE